MAHSGYRNNKQMLQTVIISFMRQWKKNKPLLIPIQRGYIQRRRNNQRKLEKNLLEYIEDSIKIPSPEKISILPEMVMAMLRIVMLIVDLILFFISFSFLLCLGTAIPCIKDYKREKCKLQEIML